MINDVKSTHYISWTDLGTSFVVSNVGEFSRSILGSHFKHNNVCCLPCLVLNKILCHIWHILLFWTPNLLMVPVPIVFKLCTSAEHVWVPQDQQGRFSIRAIIKLSLTLYSIRHHARNGRPRMLKSGNFLTTSSSVAVQTFSTKSRGRLLNPTPR